jgi:hypothetical protein
MFTGIKQEEDKVRSQLVLPFITEEQKSGKFLLPVFVMDGYICA